MYTRTLVLLYITQACAAVLNGTVGNQLNARVIFYSGFCGVDLRASTSAVHNECNAADVRAVLQDDPVTGQPQYLKMSGESNNPAPANTQCDHYMELQIVNSVARAPTDTAPFPNNGACSAINAMLDTMKGDFPLGGPTYAEYKTSFIQGSPLFTRTNQRPNTYWVNTEINQLKGKLVTRFLTTNEDFAQGDLTAREIQILSALKAYIRDRSARSFVEGLADDLEGAWQNLIDDVDEKMATLIGQRWGPNSSARNAAIFAQKMDQLQNGKNKFMPNAASLSQRFDAAMNFIVNHPFAA
ncbi:hypothetical protein MVEN_00687500 [Mycena venus]|uniref:Uncharacterized protein n=1 Tax=Mycena venus TaxID=2733690 RepID=A0A8H7D5G7_9AGAR|nr:hypothetical protein MVEN_00687500 [Mycena venus]